MPIVIKRRVNLDFLGEEYKDAYIIFQRIPVIDLEKLQDDSAKLEDSKSVKYMLDTLKKYFISGEFPGIDKLTADDLDGLDSESLVACFREWTGQSLDPKVESPSTTQSITEPTTTE